MNSYPFGHHASEDDEPAPHCPYCGGLHWSWQPCDEEGPAWVEGDEPDEPSDPSWSYEQVNTPSEN